MPFLNHLNTFCQGDQVNGSFLRRVKKDVEHGKNSPYDWTVILGGTKDLGWGQAAEDIFENLSKSLSADGLGPYVSPKNLDELLIAILWQRRSGAWLWKAILKF